MLTSQVDIRRIENALKAFPSRVMLKGDSTEAWDVCFRGLQALLSSLADSIFTDRGKDAAAAWMHWRKSSTSKQLLSLLRSVLELQTHGQGAASRDAAVGAGAAGAPTLTEHSAASVHSRRDSVASHAGIFCTGVIDLMFLNSQSAALWPAMREWLVNQGGIQSIWTALAWSISLGDIAIDQERERSVSLGRSAEQVLMLTSELYHLGGRELSVQLAQHPSVIASLQRLLGDVLPRDVAARGKATWDMFVMLPSVSGICLQSNAGEGILIPLQSLLHRPLLVAWPFLMTALRQEFRSAPTGTTTTPAGRLEVLCALCMCPCGPVGLSVSLVKLCDPFLFISRQLCHFRPCNPSFVKPWMYDPPIPTVELLQLAQPPPRATQGHAAEPLGPPLGLRRRHL